MTEVARERRERILDAAAVSFARRGFHGASMQEICAEADMSPGSVYRYYSSKEDIVEALIEKDRAEGVEMIRRAMGERGLRAPEAFAAMMNEVLEWLREKGEMGALRVEVLAEAARNPRAAALVRRNDDILTEELAGTIQAAQEAGDVDPELEPGASAKVLLSLADGLAARRGAEPDADPLGYAETVTTLVHKFLASADAGGGEGGRRTTLP